MEQVDTGGIVRGSEGAFVFHSRPRCSLTRSQECWFFWSLVGVCVGTAIAFASLGYWLILPFSGLEIGLLAWALNTLRHQEVNFETLTIKGDEVLLEWRTKNQNGRREMNRPWVRVELCCVTPGRNCRLGLKSHGRETEVGHYLSDEARMKLAATLRKRLQE